MVVAQPTMANAPIKSRVATDGDVPEYTRGLWPPKDGGRESDIEKILSGAFGP